ncbi:transmembrane protein 18-like [Gigantopelta aegis]|uniref:transmembrane protein 18-like n=1 Tax=Gigantopelta aegis TaxID=1735272 RepID=UPI001B889431|nr:transmembrane protein 18-like [Gigantopelta aegis]
MDWHRTDKIDSLWTFVLSIDWTEKWLQGLLLFHLASFGLTYLIRHNGTLQIAHFTVSLLLVWCAEYINEEAAKYWKLFSNQQYFDSNGLFISVVFSMPILCNCLVIVMMWLFNAGNLMVQVKRVQLVKEAKRQKLKEAEKND